MTKEYALKRISNQVEKKCPNESIATKVFIKEVIYADFVLLENTEEDYTSMKNLKYALVINLEDCFDELLHEARKECR